LPLKEEVKMYADEIVELVEVSVKVELQ